MMSDNIIPQRVPANQPIRLFWEATSHARLHQLWAWLTRRCFCLLDLDQILEQATVTNQSLRWN